MRFSVAKYLESSGGNGGDGTLKRYLGGSLVSIVLLLLSTISVFSEVYAAEVGQAAVANSALAKAQALAKGPGYDRTWVNYEEKATGRYFFSTEPDAKGNFFLIDEMVPVVPDVAALPDIWPPSPSIPPLVSSSRFNFDKYTVLLGLVAGVLFISNYRAQSKLNAAHQLLVARVALLFRLINRTVGKQLTLKQLRARLNENLQPIERTRIQRLLQLVPLLVKSEQERLAVGSDAIAGMLLGCLAFLRHHEQSATV